MRLDKYQREAVESNFKNTLVVAAPGSGKTTVIINRVAYLVNNLKVNPRNILVITFTKAAAINMKERYEKIKDIGYSPFFGTFHGLCYKLLLRHYKEIKIIESRETYKLISRSLMEFSDSACEDKIKEVINNISLHKCSLKTIEEFQGSIDKEVFIKAYENYENYKSSKGLLDFDDLQIQLKKLLSENPSILKGYRSIFKHILVDEFQDCDGLQIDLLKSIGEEGEVFAVGDEDQCIYSFRGSKPECMVNFNKYFKNGEKIYLKVNYRSKENIVKTSKNLITNNTLRNLKDINANREDEGKIVKFNPFDENLQCNDIGDKIKEYKSLNEGNYSEHAVLYRTNLESRSLIDAFIRKKIPFLLLDKEYNFFNHFICKDIISYLKLSINPSDRESFLRIINKPFRYISKSTLEKVRNHPYDENVFDILEKYQDMKAFQLKNMDRLRKDINYLNKINLKGAADFILSDLGYIDYIKEYCLKFKSSIDELEEIIEEFKSSLEEFNSILMFLVHVEKVEEEMKNSSKVKNDEDRVIFSTIHGVKGMEFKNVHIINCSEEYIPHKRCKDELETMEEERRLFYVGITRAIDNLYLYSPRRIKGEFIKSSPFIEECKIENKIDYCGYEEGITVTHKIYGQGIIEELKDDIIKIKFNDIVRSFNFNVLLNNKLIDIVK
ncbi:ATP-dependent helicase [Clostridium hydrogeniformans]|uniref:ATP-dependent helicase n=1 Tax=Clostridium hydrogeniformans TaxID=349933 RepID=UPI000487816D|nr:ATP-dependent helicase [Clostridium hydrogeniformans]